MLGARHRGEKQASLHRNIAHGTLARHLLPGDNGRNGGQNAGRFFQYQDIAGDGGMTAQARRLYTDLLIRTIANTIYGDPPMGPWSGKHFDPAVREAGSDWPSQAHSMVGIARLENLRDLTQAVIDEHITGDFIETGVWRGGCCILMRGVLVP